MGSLSRSTSLSPRRTGDAARRAILEVAEALLLRGGKEGLSVRRVAEHSGYSIPTVEDHFGDRSGLLVAVLENHFREMLLMMSTVPRGLDAAHYLRGMARAFIRFALAHPDHYRLITSEPLRSAGIPSAEAARELIKDALAELLREGRLTTPEVETAFQILWVVVTGLIALHLVHPYDYALDDALLERTFDALEVGLLRPPLG